MSEALRAKVERIPEHEWKPYKSLSERASVNEERECPKGGPGEVIDFIPNWKRNHKKSGEALRTIAIRVRTRQRELFESEASAWRHFAVVTNMDWQGDRLLRWHREEQGTVVAAHGVLKNDLGGSCLPTGKFGSKREAAPLPGGASTCWHTTCSSCSRRAPCPSRWPTRAPRPSASSC